MQNHSVNFTSVMSVGNSSCNRMAIPWPDFLHWYVLCGKMINQAIQKLKFGSLINRRMAAAMRFRQAGGDAKQEWVRSLERHEELNVGALAVSSPPPQASQPKSDEGTSASSEQQVSTDCAYAVTSER